MASIIDNLISDISSFTAEKIQQNVTKGLAAAQKTGKLNAEQLAAYEHTLRTKYQKQEADLQKQNYKKILDDTYKYAESKEEKASALREKARLAEEEKISQRKIALEERYAAVVERQAKIQEEREIAREEARIAREEKRVEKATQSLEKNAETITKAGNQIWSSATSNIEKYFDSFGRYYTDIETRLLGTGRNYESVKGLIDDAVGVSGIVKQTDVLNKIVNFLEKGITRDTELRAVIASLSDKIAATFDALDPTLLSLGRILQQDTTVARLGMESSLTQFLNAQYQDTSYLTSDMNVFVQSQLLNSLSTMTAEVGTQVEYAVQKWLGSFASVGVAEDTIRDIAQGLGYIGGGNISALSSDTQLMNLLLAAANAGGVDIASMMTSGLTVENVNALMQGIYRQASVIASSGDNVVRNQYAQMYGLNLSDLVGFSNLTSADIEKIQGNNMTYGDMTAQTISEIAKVQTRIATSTYLSNVFDNVFATVGDTIASNAGTYITWKIADMITNAGGLSIPSFLGMGTGFAQLPDIDQLMKAGVLTGSIIANMGTVISSLARGGNIDINALMSASQKSSSEYSQIAGFTNAQTGNTGATFIGNTSESSIYENSMAQVKDMVTATGQGADDEDKAATTGDINRLIATLEAGIRIKTDDTTVLNNGPVIRWG